MNSPIRAYLRKRKGGKFQARFYCAGRIPKEKVFAFGTSDPTVARQILSDLERQIQFGEWDPWTDPMPEAGLFASEAVARFLTAKKQAVRATTVRAYKGTLEAFAKALPPGTMIEHVTAKQCEAFYNRSTLSKTSRRSYARDLRSFMNWSAKAGLIKVSPMKGVKLPKAPLKMPTFLTREQFGHLVRTIDAYATIMESDADLTEMLKEAFGLDFERSKHAAILDGQVRWMIDLLTVACGTGLRSGEIRSMRWDWINLDEGTITVQDTPDFTPKTGDERMIYVGGDASKVLRRLYVEAGEPGADLVFPGFHGEKMDKDYLSKRFRFFRDLAKMPTTLRFHSTRHTYASWLVQWGVDLYRVQKLCGHRSVTTTMRYAHLAPKNLRDAVELAFGDQAVTKG